MFVADLQEWLAHPTILDRSYALGVGLHTSAVTVVWALVNMKVVVVNG